MAVAFDAVGPSSAGAGQTTASPLTWSHTCGASATLLLVGVAVGGTTGANTVTATYNGVSMTAVDTQASNNNTDGFVKLFKLVSPATGANTVSISASIINASNPIEGGSQSYIGANDIQNVTKAGGASVTPSVTVASSVGNMTAAFMCDASAFSGTNQTLRFRNNMSVANAAGNLQGVDAAGAASVTLTGTAPSDWWGVIGVDIIAAGGGAAYPFELLTPTPRAY